MQQQQAADRLQLAYEQLGSKEEMAANALEGKMQLAQSQMDLKDQTMKLGAALRERGLDQQLSNINSLIQKRGSDEELAQARLELSGAKNNANKPFNYGGVPYMRDPTDPTGTKIMQVPGFVPKPKEPTETYKIHKGGKSPVDITMGKTAYDRIIRMQNATKEWQGIADEVENNLRSSKGIAPSQLTPTAPQAESPPAPSQGTGKKMVRVKGPNGQTGSVPEDSALPEGWEVVK